jgi:hypothetical protein
VKWLVATVAAASVLVALSVPAFGNHPPGPPERVTICHKPGTPDEQELTLPHNAAEHHIAAHGDTEGPCVPPIVDAIIDADGTASPQSGDPAAREVTPGTALANFPVTNFNDSGLDMFDQDGNQAWTLGPSGDDLHAEGSAFCPTAIRDGVHQLGFDCKVLDINGDLADGDQVDCDLEVGVSFSGMPCPPPGVRYHDANNNGAWDDGEDIVLDQNNNGVFD